MTQVFTDAQIQEILSLMKQHFSVQQYIGARYVPIFGRKGEDSIEWDNSAPYEPLTIVLYQGNSFTSRQYVPTGVDINNNEFWAETGNYNAQIEQYRQEVLGFDSRIDNLESIASISTNPIDYGADPTGVNDSADAINACIEANKGGTIVFSPGTYRINTSILTPHPVDERVNIDFNGAIIDAHTHYNAAIVIGQIDYAGNVFAGYSHNWFKNGTIVKNGEVTGIGFQIKNNHKDILIDNMYIVDFATGIQVGQNDDNRGAGDVQITNCLLVIKQAVIPESAGIQYWGSDSKVNNSRIYGFQFAIDAHSSGIYVDNVHCLPKAWADTTNGENGTTAFARIVGGHNNFINCYVDTMGKCIEIQEPESGFSLPNFNFKNCQYFSYKTEGFDICLFDFSKAGAWINANIVDCNFDCRRPTPNDVHTGIKLPNRETANFLLNKAINLKHNNVLGSFTEGDLIWAYEDELSPYLINKTIGTVNGWIPIRIIPMISRGWMGFNLEIYFPTFIATDRLHFSINPQGATPITSFQAKRETATSNPNLKYGAEVKFNSHTNNYYMILYMYNTATLWGDVMVKSTQFDSYMLTPNTAQQFNLPFDATIVSQTQPTFVSTDV